MEDTYITVNLEEIGVDRINMQLAKRLDAAIKRTLIANQDQADWMAGSYYGVTTCSGGLAELALYYHLTGDADAAFNWWVENEQEDPWATTDVPGFIEVKQANGKDYSRFFPNVKSSKLHQIKASNQVWFAQTDNISTDYDKDDRRTFIGSDTKRSYWAKKTQVNSASTVTFKDVLVVNDVEDLLKTDLFDNCGLDQYLVPTGKTTSYKFRTKDWDLTTRPTDAVDDARALLKAATAA